VICGSAANKLVDLNGIALFQWRGCGKGRKREQRQKSKHAGHNLGFHNAYILRQVTA
jgi:hypothetical protein